ncbi:MAG TPA: hypothetical protein VKN36_18715 [Eudoraea sp.]|nr:hypothetical protein [Eudoraea sp.]
MHPKTIKYTYLEWLSTEEMHEASLRWFSELKFMRDEQMFLNNLVTSYTLQLVDSRIFDESKKVIAQLQKAEKDIVPLFKKVQAHENQLEIMLDDVEQPKMERAYIATHKELLIAMQAYLETYREIKDSLFIVVSEVIKKGKQKRLLN